MSRILLLFSIMNKNTRMLQNGKNDALKKVGMYFLVFLAVLLYGGLAIAQFFGLLSTGLTSLAISMAFALQVLFVAFLVALTIPTIFYFSNDLKIYLAMPFTPNQIIASKTLVIAYGMSPIIIGITACFIIAGIMVHAFGLLQYILIAIGLLVAGYVTIVVIGILEMIMMRFMPLFRDKDRFMLVMGTFVTIGTVALMMMLNKMNFEGSMDLSTLHIPLEFFPPAWACYRLIIEPSLLNALIAIVMVAICFSLFWLCAKTLYLDTARNASMTTTKKKKAKKIEASKSSIRTILIKTEFKNLFRSPTYLMNNVISGFLVPVIMVVSFSISLKQSGGESIDIATLVPMILEHLQIEEFWIGALIGICCAWMCTSFNMVASTAISRQGRKGIHWMLSIPTPITTHLKAFTYVGTIFSLINAAVFVVPLFIWLRVGWMMWLGLLVGIIPSTIFENVLNLAVDCFHPTLDWSDENESIKKNTNTLIGLVIMAIQMVVVLVPIFLKIKPKLMIIFVLVLMIIGCLLTKPILDRLSKRVMDM